MLACAIFNILIGSHPELVPCDIYQEEDFLKFSTKVPTAADVQFVSGPRHIGSRIHSQWVFPATLRAREYFHLPGLLLKWYRIYGKNTLCYLQFQSAVLTRLHLL
jgi:hypothetical protein